jgi:hypothetical protein
MTALCGCLLLTTLKNIKMYIRGIKSLKMGACGADGAMGALLDTIFEDFVGDSVSVDFPVPQVKPITPDDKPNPIVLLVDDSVVMKLIFSTFKCDPDSMATLFGGTVALEKWSAPTSRTLILQSVELVSKNLDGFHEVLTAPKCGVVAGYTGKHNKSGVAEIKVEMYILTPKDAAGADLSPVQKEKVAAV